MSRDLPDYAHATPEDLAQACRAAIEECDARIVALVAIPAGQRTFGNTVLAVEEARAAAKEARLAWACWRTPLPTSTRWKTPCDRDGGFLTAHTGSRSH